MMLTVADLGSN